MKKYLLAACMLGMTGLITQCDKGVKDIIPDSNLPDTTANNNNDHDNNGNGDVGCSGMNNDEIRIGTEVFVRDTESANSYLNICMEFDFSSTGRMFLKHERSLYYKDGDYIAVPTINILLGDVPPPGTTKTYTLDEGKWMLSGSEVSSEGKAIMMIEGYYTRNKHRKSWFCFDGSGTIDATADANGDVTFNFNVRLIESGTADTYVEVCGKNVICQK